MEKEFQESLSKLYKKGTDKSGWEGCTKLIHQNYQDQESVGVFLSALSKKDLLTFAKSQTNGAGSSL